MHNLPLKCKDCELRYETSQQLENHQRKFCKGSEYGNLEALDRKYNQEKARREYGISNEAYLQKEKEEMERDPIAKRKSAEEVQKRQEKQKSLEKDFREESVKREKEIRAKIERESIRETLSQKDKQDLVAAEIEKQRQLAVLEMKREEIRRHERQLKEEIEKMEKEPDILDEMREEGYEKKDKWDERRKTRIKENNKVNDLLKAQKFERAAELKVQKEGFDYQRQVILKDLDRLRRDGSLDSIRRKKDYFKPDERLRGGDNNDFNTGKGFERPNSRRERERNQRMAREVHDMDQTIRTERSFVNGVEDIVEQIENQRIPNEHKARQLSAVRQKLYEPGKPIIVVDSKGKKRAITPVPERSQNRPDSRGETTAFVKEVQRIRGGYLDNGGSNPSVLRALENIERRRRQQKSLYEQNREIYTPESALFEDPEEQSILLRKGSASAFSHATNTANEIQKLLDEKEHRNQDLRKQIEEVKKIKLLRGPEAPVRSSSVSRLPEIRQPSLDNTKKYNQLVDTRQFYRIAENHTGELTEEEKVLASLAAQEVDSMRMLSLIPHDTEIYRFKLDQFKDISATRAEIEKVVQEQRIMKLRHRNEAIRRDEDKEFDRIQFTDGLRKKLIDLQSGNGINPAKRPPSNMSNASFQGDRQPYNNHPHNGYPTKSQKYYNPANGFRIHWDYCLGLPDKIYFIQIVYGVYVNGQEVVPPTVMGPLPCERDEEDNLFCLINATSQLEQMGSNPSALLVFEFQVTDHAERGKGHVISYAWSLLELFDQRYELRRGKFKVPMYEVPTVPGIEAGDVRFLNQIDNGAVWMHMRITYNNDEEDATFLRGNWERTQREYLTPQIHLRAFKSGRPDSRNQLPRREFVKPPVKPDSQYDPSKSDLNHVNIQPINPSFYENINPNQLQQKPSDPLRRKILRKIPTSDEEDNPVDGSTPQNKASEEQSNPENDQHDLELGRIEGDDDDDPEPKEAAENQSLPHFSNNMFLPQNEDANPSHANANLSHGNVNPPQGNGNLSQGNANVSQGNLNLSQGNAPKSKK